MKLSQNIFVVFALVAAIGSAAPAGATAVKRPLSDDGLRDVAAPAPEGAPSWDLAFEVLKQSVEQPLHFAMSAGPIWLSRLATAVPWYGWSIIPVLAYREWRQWPSERWWDPPLDAAFLILGLIATTWPARTRLPMSWSRRRARIVALSTLAARA